MFALRDASRGGCAVEFTFASSSRVRLPCLKANHDDISSSTIWYRGVCGSSNPKYLRLPHNPRGLMSRKSGPPTKACPYEPVDAEVRPICIDKTSVTVTSVLWTRRGTHNYTRRHLNTHLYVSQPSGDALIGKESGIPRRLRTFRGYLMECHVAFCTM